MNNILRYFFLALMFCLLSATVDDYTLIRKIAFKQEVSLTTDNLGNAYVVVENQVLKFDPKGLPLENFSEPNMGSLKYVDAGNPLRILLFYPDFARLLVLDSKLAIQANINLRQLNINQPLTACNSSESGYWVYDRDDDKLKKINPNQQVTYESGILMQVTGYQVEPGMMVEGNGYLYMNNPATGLLVFDRFGAYYKTIPVPDIQSFQVVENDILYVRDNKLIRYNTKTISQSDVLLPQIDSIRSARIEQHQLYLLTSDSLNFYSF